MKVFTLFALILIMASIPLFSGGTQEEPPMMDGGLMDGGMMAASGSMDSEDMGPYVDFVDPDHAMMLAEEKPTVLFFNASWCPSCKSAIKDFDTNVEKLADVNLILVDYDHSADLQTKYGVTYQHTFVQIDPNGQALVVWNGGGTDELLANLIKEM